MIKIIIFGVLLIIIITSFTLNLGFFTNGFNNIRNFLDGLPEFLEFLKELIQLIFNAPILSTIALTGIAFVVIQYGLSLIGDEKK